MKNSKSSLKNSFKSEEQPASQEKNDFLDNSHQALNKSKVSEGKDDRQKQLNRSNVSERKQGDEGQADNVWQNQQDDQNNGQNEEHEQNMLQQSSHLKSSHLKSSRKTNNQHDNIVEQDPSQLQDQEHYDKNQSQDHNNDQLSRSQITQNQIKQLLNSLKKQLKQLNQSQHPNGSQIKKIEQQIQVLQIKLHLQKKLSNRKQAISIQRINHLEHIFKHYCTHIFKTGKHMTFDRLQYEKMHLTIDRLCVFLKDFNLTTIKDKEGRVRELIQKQEIIKFFKKVSPNCRDLDFQQFIIIIEKLGELYFDSKINYEQRKHNERKQRLKIKENLQKKEKLKQELIKKHQQKMSLLEKGVQLMNEVKDKVVTQMGQNDDLIQKMINEDGDNGQQNGDNNEQPSKRENSNQKPKQNKTKKSASSYSKTFKKPVQTNQQKNNQNPLTTLTKQQKIEYFYQIINVDDVQSFGNKLRQLNLPLFKIYSQQNIKNKDMNSTNTQRKDQYVAVVKGQETQDQKRLKQLREKLNERNQKLKHASVSSLSREQYEQRKINRSRVQQEDTTFNSSKKKEKKIDISATQINLSSLSKLAYENINFTKFNPKNLYSKADDDEIFMKQYADSPVKVKKSIPGGTQMSKATQNTKRMMQQKEKNSENFLQKLKQRQQQVELTQKKEEVSQMYRFNDRTQRQKRLIDKFLEKNR